MTVGRGGFWLSEVIGAMSYALDHQAVVALERCTSRGGHQVELR